MYMKHLLGFILPFAQLDFLEMETAKNPFQYLEEKNYNYENHTITTEDGYQLLLVRLCCRRNKIATNRTRPPLLFVHGLMASFYDFIIAGPNAALPFKALEDGYDVFLLNCRGNTFSKKHKMLNPDLQHDKFWNFSWHEIGLYDLPAAIDYILKTTGSSQISYVGHSQGSATFLAMTSTIPSYNEKIRTAVLLSPAVYMKNSGFSFKLFLKVTVGLAKIFQTKEVWPHEFIINMRQICEPKSPFVPLCIQLYTALGGPSTHVNYSVVHAFLTNYPAGASLRQCLHFLQIIDSGEFRPFDYGEDGNVEEYGESTPPDYDLAAVTAPIAVYHGKTDHVVSEIDVVRLVTKLPNVMEYVILLSVPTNHIDILISTQVNEPVLRFLNRYNKL